MNEVIVITGQRGKGKSTYIKNHIEDYDRVVIFDLLGEFTYYHTSHTLEEFFKELSKNKKEDFFILNYYNPKNSERDFEIICKAINRNENLMFVIDELDYFCSANYIPHSFAEIIKRGRHQNLNVMIATRRPHEIPRLVTSQVSQFITFRHLEIRDLEYMKDVCGFDKEEIQSLPDFNFLCWHNGQIEKGLVKLPEIKGRVIELKGREKIDSELENFFLEEESEEIDEAESF